MEAEFTYVDASSAGRDVADHTGRLLHVIEDAGFVKVMPAPGTVVGKTSPLIERLLAGHGDAVAGWTHRPHVLDPICAARDIAAIDTLSGGHVELRVEAHFGEAADRFGLASHVARMQFLDEYLVLLKRLWSNDKPFEHQGRYFSFSCGYVPRKGPRGSAIPLRLSGMTGAAIRVAARHASVVEITPVAPDHARRHIARIREIASHFGRANRVRFALPVSLAGQAGIDAVPLSGKPEDIALKLLEYADAGVSEFMISGLADEEAIAAFGSTVRPIVANSLRRLAAPTAPAAPERREALP